MNRTTAALATATLACGAFALTACSSDTVDALTGKTVTYEVTSDSGKASTVTYSGKGGNQSQETDVTLPWKKADVEADIAVLSAQNSGGGAITCRILRDGKVQVEQTSNGEYAVVTCQK